MLATREKAIRLASTDEIDIEKTFECGQCFRWNADENGVYTGVARGHAARIYNENGGVYVVSDADEDFWRDYLDLDRDYVSISRAFDGGDYLRDCVENGMGIHILNQDPWEALCSFIISQCNNIPRIKGIVERLCDSFGGYTELEGVPYRTFPGAEIIAPLEEKDLSPLRCGYRAPYIITAARAVCDGSLDLDALTRADAEEARAELKKLNGIGDKVANCVVLFGLRHMEAFPIDVWIRRALKEHFPPDFDPKSLGEYAGLAQQYIFYSARNN